MSGPARERTSTVSAPDRMRSVTGSEDAIRRLLDPGTVALVGASGKNGTLASWPLRLLGQYGFAGRIVPVNPTRDEIAGLACAPSVAEIDGDIDVAVITLNRENTVLAVEECAAAGVGAVVLPAQGFGEGGPEGRALEARMLDVARARGMRIHGPNSDGVANFATGAVLSIQPVLGLGVELGEVAIVTQSGATAGSLISRLAAEGIGTRLYASAGNEIDLGFADYLSVALQDPEIKIVLSFIETIRRPEQFSAVARLAQELGKPIVAIKVGRTGEAAARAAAHTGALAGEDRIYDALFASLGVIRVDELSEIVAVAKLFLANGPVKTSQVGLMSVSGGQAGALADRAAAFGVTLPPFSLDAETRLSALLPHGNGLNPSDLTGDVATRPNLAAEVYRIFDSDPSIDSVVYARKDLTGGMGLTAATALVEARDHGSTALAVYSMDGPIGEAESATYRDGGVPVFASASELFTAVAGLARSTAQTLRPVPDPDVRGWVTGSGVMKDADARAALSRAGVVFPAEAVVASAEQAVLTAEGIGWPVALKVADARIAHKTEIGGVLLGIRSADEVREGYAVLMERARAALGGSGPEGVLVQQQVDDGVEFIVGVVVDPQFGPFVLVGTGGVMAELLNDTALWPAPVTRAEARQLIGRLKGSALLEGFRGSPPADIDGLVDTVVRVSEFGHAHRNRLRELDLNPVLVRPAGRGALAADALIVLKDEETDTDVDDHRDPDDPAHERTAR